MKDSGIPWIGKVPEGWEISKNRFIMHKVKDICVKWRGENVLSLSMNGVVVRDIENPSGKMPKTFDGYQYIKPRELVLCLFDLDVTPRCVGRSVVEGIISPAYSRYIIHSKNDIDFIYYYYLAMDDNRVLEKLGNNCRHAIPEYEFRKLPIILPPLPEQEKIADYLDKECDRINTLRDKIKREIERLDAYKKSAITEAVCRGLNPKAKMKDSGIPWIGKVPEGWKIKRIAELYAVRSEKVSDKEHQPLTVGKMGVVPQLEHVAKTNNGDNRKHVSPNDFVINSRSDRRGACGISSFDGSVSQINIVLKPKNGMCAQYFNWLFHTELFADEFYKWGKGIDDDVWSTRWMMMKKITISFPPLPEQKKIADWIDKMVARVDGMIAKRKQQLEALDKLKKTIVYDYVTGKKEVPQ